MIQNTYFMKTGPWPLVQWRDSPSRSSESIIKVKWQLARPGPGGDLQQLSTLSSPIKGNGRSKNFDNEEILQMLHRETWWHRRIRSPTTIPVIKLLYVDMNGSKVDIKFDVGPAWSRHFLAPSFLICLSYKLSHLGTVRRNEIDKIFL